MKLPVSNLRNHGLTRVEVVVIVAVLFVLVILFSSPRLHESALRQNCYNTLRCEGYAFRLWAGDNKDKFPMQLSTNNGGAKEPLAQGNIAAVFLVMSNELCNPRFVFCPSDSRTLATNWGQFSNQHLSYFVGVDASCPTNLSDAANSGFLVGDRNLVTGKTQTAGGILELRVDQPGRWTSEMHHNRGNVCLADGSVLKLNDSSLQKHIESSSTTTNRLAIP